MANIAHQHHYNMTTTAAIVSPSIEAVSDFLSPAFADPGTLEVLGWGVAVGLGFQSLAIVLAAVLDEKPLDAPVQPVGTGGTPP